MSYTLTHTYMHPKYKILTVFILLHSVYTHTKTNIAEMVYSTLHARDLF